MNPTKAEVDAVAAALLATVEEQKRLHRDRLWVAAQSQFFGVTAPVQRVRSYPPGCTCRRLPADGTRQTYAADCPIDGHQRLRKAGW